MQAILGQKKSQTQKFLENGTRIPVTILSVGGNVVTQVKQVDKEGYVGVQIGFGQKKHAGRALLGHAKKAGMGTAPRFIREVRLPSDTAGDTLPTAGDVLKIEEVFKPGDIVKVTGKSKGKGFAGVVKRHHFRGGPRTHGQSDRERAPGSIGQTTTPGRVYRGKRMAGHMGTGNATVTNLEVVDIDPKKSEILVKGLLPGSLNTILFIERTGEAKNFVPLIGAVKADEEVVSDTAEAVSSAEEAMKAEPMEKEEASAEITEAKAEEAVDEAPVEEQGKDAEEVQVETSTSAEAKADKPVETKAGEAVEEPKEEAKEDK